MQRVTITLDDDLMADLDRIIAARGYQNRSEAIRDLARSGLEHHLAGARALGDDPVRERRLGQRQDAVDQHAVASVGRRPQAVRDVVGARPAHRGRSYPARPKT